MGGHRLNFELDQDAGVDELRDSPCSAHISGKLLISPARITHRCRSLPPQIGAHEHVLECVLEREFEKSLFSLPVICMQDSTGTYLRARDPHRSSRRTSCTPLAQGLRGACCQREHFSAVSSSILHRGKMFPSRVRVAGETLREGRAGGAARGGAPRGSSKTSGNHALV